MPLNNYLGVQPGTYTFEDNGIPGDGISVLKNSSGEVIFTLIHSADAWNLDVLGSGVNLIFNITDSFGAASVTIGNMSTGNNPASIQVRNIGATTGTVTLVADGAITEFGNDAAPDIVAGALALIAGDGVGTPANALETRVAAFESKTNSGGIHIGNFGAVTIGGVSSDVEGLQVIASGDIHFTNLGSITIADFTGVNGSVNAASGDVVLTANGFESDIFSRSNRNAMHSPEGGIALSAGRDILLGTTPPNYDNNLFALEAISLSAGRDIILENAVSIGASVSPSNETSGAGVTLTAGRDITLAGPNVSVGASGFESNGITSGDVVLTAGPGGIVTISAGTFPGLYSTSADVIVNADRLHLGAGTAISAISATIRPVTPGWAINLVGNTIDTLFALDLADSELDRISANHLTLGSGDSGPVTISSAMTLASANLVIRSGTDITVNSTLIAADSISLHASNDVLLSGSAAIGTGAFSIFLDAPNTDPGIGARTILGGSVGATSIAITGGDDEDLLTGTNEADIILGAGGHDWLIGRSGNDTLIGGAGNDTMHGGFGDDVYFIDSAGDIVVESTGEGNDRVAVSVSFVLSAGASVETFETTNLAGTGAINLTGNGVNQFIIGNNGNNMLQGGGGNDWMIGAGGNDTLIGNSSAGVLEGGLGNDVYFVIDSSDLVMETSGGGFDRLALGTSYALSASAEVEHIETSNLGSTAALNITGNQFAQLIVGNNGANVLDGKGGADVLVGAGGADTFAFTFALGGSNIDRIDGFQVGIDKIALDDAVFGNGLAPGSLDPNRFVIGTSAQDADDRIIYDSATGALFYDADGNGTGAAIQFATVAGAPSLAASDFMVI